METALGIVGALGTLGGMWIGMHLITEIDERQPYAYALAWAAFCVPPVIIGIGAVELCLWMG